MAKSASCMPKFLRLFTLFMDIRYDTFAGCNNLLLHPRLECIHLDSRCKGDDKTQGRGRKNMVIHDSIAGAITVSGATNRVDCHARPRYRQPCLVGLRCHRNGSRKDAKGHHSGT